MNQSSRNNSDEPKKSKETIIHIVIMVLFIVAIGYLGYNFIWNNNTTSNNQQETVNIEVYFSNLKVQSGGEDCTTTFPVSRTILKTNTLAETALEKLFEGTTTNEEGQGLHTDISPEFTIKRLTISEGIATVELRDDLELLGYSACTANTIKTQITKTLEQFSNIDDVIITVNNKTNNL